MRFESFVKNQAQGDSGSNNGQSRQKEGDIFISKNKPNSAAKSDKIGGEYVDYEEVD